MQVTAHASQQKSHLNSLLNNTLRHQQVFTGPINAAAIDRELENHEHVCIS